MCGINVWFIEAMDHDCIFKKYCLYLFIENLAKKMGKRHQEFVTYLVSLKYRLMNANEGGKISVLTIQV